MHRGLLSVLSCLSLGCGPVVLPGDGDGSGSAGSDDATSSATTTAATAATAATTATTATTISTTATTGDSEDDDDDDGILWDCGAAPPGTMHHCTAPPTCDPGMSDVLAWITVDGGARPADPMPEPYVYECTITDWTEDSSLYSFELACADAPHTLEIASSVGIWFDTAGDFLLSVSYSGSFSESSSRLVALRRADGELVLAGASTPSLPEATSDFFEPLEVSIADGLCPIEPGVDGFLGSCYDVERQALTFILDRDVEQVFDHGVGQLPPYVVIVQFAEQRHDLTCSDIPDAEYSWIAVPPIPD
jgi:hypothetical protein